MARIGSTYSGDGNRYRDQRSNCRKSLRRISPRRTDAIPTEDRPTRRADDAQQRRDGDQRSRQRRRLAAGRHQQRNFGRNHRVRPSAYGTITLTSGPLVVNAINLTIQGPGANKLTISGGGNFTDFILMSTPPPTSPPPSSFVPSSVSISGLTIADGKRQRITESATEEVSSTTMRSPSPTVRWKTTRRRTVLAGPSTAPAEWMRA